MNLLASLKSLARAGQDRYAEEEAARNAWKREHPTGRIFVPCIDDRQYPRLSFGALLGTAHSFRRAGAHVSLGSFGFREMLVHHLERSGHSQHLIFPVLHTSALRGHGCAYWDGDDDKALEHAMEFKRVMEEAFSETGQVTVVVLQHNTDDDRYALFDKDGVRHLITDLPREESMLMLRLKTLFPRMPSHVRGDLAATIQGRFQYLERHPRPTRVQHAAHMVVVGDKFGYTEWSPNVMTIHEASGDVPRQIKVACGIVKPTRGGEILLASHIGWSRQGISSTLSPRDRRAIAAASARARAEQMLNIFREVHGIVAAKVTAAATIIDDNYGLEVVQTYE